MSTSVPYTWFLSSPAQGPMEGSTPAASTGAPAAELSQSEELRRNGDPPLPSGSSLRPLRPGPPLAADAQGTQTPQAVQNFPCDKCTFVCKTQRTLKRHNDSIHPVTRCHWGGCGAELGDENAIHLHLREHQGHSGEDTVTCGWPGCGMPVRRFEIMRHLKKHNNDAARI
ncbi:hypothetical protein F5Y06DRAFT_295982 [Hypoxylon sp. FL0890]|nr:hypothetical protein F5Y06DRAFT_295982 [Hypoxylon sp. FL0890]